MKKYIIIAFCLLVAAPYWSMAQDKLPITDKPQSRVNDYAGVFSSQEKSALELKLYEFEARSSTQIFIVTLNDNGGYAASDLSQRIGEQWGVGQEGKDNGLLVLMDMQLPGIDGLQATREIKMIRPDLPVIAVTASVLDEDKDACFEAGCEGLVPKPLDFRKLLELMGFAPALCYSEDEMALLFERVQKTLDAVLEDIDVRDCIACCRRQSGPVLA